ncbi:Sporulation related domain-containing protein [Deinococcus reticulitermitis]|uniref:Sporulation related domain-containing protein n=1 Tax=Deinococcus reticulitermitis TaxID=856736 RepID=A0A1H6XH56_9DEIO|nr:SPOR domain-containing protein [Deinococcus reticulitermitis]SEJ28461.1 Sporulation related domain-containing protein [Deinococcus reticulitermitis]
MTRSRSQPRVSAPPPKPAPPARPARWPDLLTAALALAVVGGLGALWWGERPAPLSAAVVTAPIQAQIPAAPATLTSAPPAASSSSGAQVQSGATEAGTIPPVPAPPPVAEIPPPVVPEPVAPATGVPKPGGPATPSAGSDSAAPGGAGPAADVAASQAPPAPPSAVPAGVAPRAGGAVATSESRTPLRSDYRVTLGTFGSQASAEASAAPVEALGYTVYTIDLGDQFVAQVGPFADEAAGRAAQSDIQRVYPRAELYPPRGRSLGTPAPTPAVPAPPALPAAAQPSPTAPGPEAAASAGVSDPAPAPSEPTYLQVGAFNNPEGAQRLVALLREQGFSPSVNAPEGGKATVLVGPFSGEALPRAEGLLRAAGFESFRLR